MLTLAVAIGILSSATAQSAPPPVKVLLIGTFHMAGGRDLVNPNVKDILGDKRQREVLQLVDQISAFKPNKIAVERVYGSPDPQKRLDDFLAGSLEITKSEIDQVALRVAKKVGAKEMLGIDWKKDLDVMGVLNHSETTGQGQIKKDAMETIQKVIMPMAARMEEISIPQIFREQNDPAFDEQAHQLYQRLALVGQGEDYKGADMVADWYERNLKIAVNIRRISKPGDRVFVLIGAGHCKLLREFLKQTPGIEVVPALEYLK